MKSFLTSKFIKYIQSIVIDEKLSEIAIITSANISKLVDNISGNFDSLNVYNKINGALENDPQQKAIEAIAVWKKIKKIGNLSVKPYLN